MSNTTLRIGFMGTPDFSVPALKALHESDHELICVYSQPPRPKGRGHKVQPSPVHTYAQEHDIPVHTPPNFKDPSDRETFISHNLDIAVVVAYGLILPKAILDAPQYGCVNIHASLLPRWRGASPIQQAIWADDDETGISIMQMDEGLDTGPVITAQPLAINEHTTANALHDLLADMGARMIVDVMNDLAQEQKLAATAQDDNLMTYAPLLKKEDGKINWHARANAIDCQIRALTPWPGVFTHLDDKRIKIHKAQRSEDTHDKTPGTILDRDGHMACGENTILKITEIQPHNAKRMDFASAINGAHLAVGDVLQ